MGAQSISTAKRVHSRATVGVISPTRVFRECLAYGLNQSPGIKALDFSCGGRETLRRLATAPDVLIVDLACVDAPNLGRQIRDRANSKVIAIGFERVEEVVRLAEAGFVAFLPKDAGLDDLRRAVLRARLGELECSAGVAAALATRLSTLSHTNGNDQATARLTVREKQIVLLIDQGLSNKEIGQRLCIETGTVKNHVHNILDKLGVHRRGEASARCAGRVKQE